MRAGLCQAWCGRDARAPRKPSSHDIVTPRAQNCRSILVPLVVEAGPSVFVSLRVPFLLVCPFVVLRAPLWIERRRFLPLGRVEDWRVDCRVRWLFRRFHFGRAPLSRFQSPLSEPDVRPHLGSPVGSCVSHTGPRSHPWTTPMGLAPVPYSIHVRSGVPPGLLTP